MSQQRKIEGCLCFSHFWGCLYQGEVFGDFDVSFQQAPKLSQMTGLKVILDSNISGFFRPKI